VFKIFIISRLYSGSGFGTVLPLRRIGCQGFIEPDLSALLNKNQTPLRKEYLICCVKGKKDFYLCNKNGRIYFFHYDTVGWCAVCAMQHSVLSASLRLCEKIVDFSINCPSAFQPLCLYLYFSLASLRSIKPFGIGVVIKMG
jgi:hypothetical protein